MFIALEGGDGAGKSTQIPLLKAWLEARGFKVTICREPGSTQLGERIREILLFSKNLGVSQMSRMSELLLFMAARAQVVTEIIPSFCHKDADAVNAELTAFLKEKGKAPFTNL